jgi:uracil phosphoribosyltransferase
MSELTAEVTLSCASHKSSPVKLRTHISTSDRIIRLLVEEGLNHLPVVPRTVRTPVGKEFDGVAFQGRICGVSIMRGELSSGFKHSESR